MRPVIKPALRRAWRDEGTVQLGLDPSCAVVVTGIGAQLATVLDLLDGTRDTAAVAAAAARRGIGEGAGRRVVDLLLDAGVLDDAGCDAGGLTDLGPAGRDRLAPDLASLSLVHRAPGAGVAAMSRRRAAAVEVRGAGRVGAGIASLLAAAGVGRVAVDDDAPARVADASPLGLTTSDRGAPRAAALRERLRREVPTTVTTPLPVGAAPDLVVVAGDQPVTQPEHLRAPTPGEPPVLHAAVREARAVVGPLVVPGHTACLRCVELLRADRDPAWPQVAAQLAGRRRDAVDACDVALAAFTASVTALQALAWLDGSADGTPPATVGGTLELTLPAWDVRRRSWPAHPDCGCCPHA